MLAPHAVDIHSWNLSNYYLTMFHICRTIRRHFCLRQVKLCIGQRKYEQKFTTQGVKDRPNDRPSEWIRTRSLNSYFALKMRSCFSQKSCSTTFLQVHVHKSKFWETINRPTTLGFSVFIYLFFRSTFFFPRFFLLQCCSFSLSTRLPSGRRISEKA